MPDRVPLEPFGPLSQSLLWGLQRRTYEAIGVVGWQAGLVPHHATTNPRFAAAYAEVLLGFLRDCRARPYHDPTEPIHVVELGAGPGRFGYHLLTGLLDRRHHSRLRDVPVRYVLTDLAEANVAFWLGHPHLAPLLDAGLLDVARFDVVHGDALQLRRSGVVLDAGSLANPVAVVANYLFDSIPQDAFRVTGGEVVHLHAAATSSQPEDDLDDPDVVGRIELAYAPAAAPPDLDAAALAVLDRYRSLGDTGPLLFPSAAVRCLDRLADLADWRLLLLSGDKGFTRTEELRRAEAPEVVAHGGAFSLTVDLGAIGGWFEQQGGERMAVERSSLLHVSAGLLGFGGGTGIETAGAYRAAVAEQDPIDVFTIVLERDEPETDVDRILALLRLTGGDHEVLLQHLPALTEAVEDVDDEQRAELLAALHLVRDRYFPIGEDLDLPYFLSRAFFDLGDLATAIELLHESLAVYGADGWTLFNLAQCLLAAGDVAGADAAAAQAEAFEDAAGEAAAFRDRLRSPGRSEEGRAPI